MAADSEPLPHTQRRPPPPPLPEPSALTLVGKCVVTYVDAKPASHMPQQLTVVLIHGSPGTFKDFRYLIPLLERDGARVIGLNLPGFGGSNVLDTQRYYERISALGEAAIAFEALALICKGKENVFLVGHSFGGHATINLAAMNTEQSTLQLRGIALLASAGYRPHRAMWPMTSAVLSNVVSAEIPVMSSLTASLVRVLFVQVVGFPSKETTSHYVAGLIRCRTTDFDVVNDHIKRVAHIPTFIAFAKDDECIERVILEHMSKVCCTGPRFVFDKGGHNIQKTKAEFLAVELHRWISELLHETPRKSEHQSRL